jgi:hypothetical protein
MSVWKRYMHNAHMSARNLSMMYRDQTGWLKHVLPPPGKMGTGEAVNGADIHSGAKVGSKNVARPEATAAALNMVTFHHF